MQFLVIISVYTLYYELNVICYIQTKHRYVQNLLVIWWQKAIYLYLFLKRLGMKKNEILFNFVQFGK